MPKLEELLGNRDVQRVNHHALDPRCSGDSKSMRIWRESNGHVRGYCYRCNRHYVERGSYRPDILVDEPRALVPPAADATMQWDKWHSEARTWLRKARITECDSYVYGIRHSWTQRALYIPSLYNDDLRGVIVRNFDTRKPRTVARFRHGVPRCYVTYCSIAAPLVICEDALSAIRLARANYNALALLGTALTAHVLEHPAVTTAPSYVVWLDNDNAHVRVAALQLAKRLSALGSTRIVTHYSDPKHYTDEEINNALFNVHQ